MKKTAPSLYEVLRETLARPPTLPPPKPPPPPPPPPKPVEEEPIAPPAEPVAVEPTVVEPEPPVPPAEPVPPPAPEPPPPAEPDWFASVPDPVPAAYEEPATAAAPAPEPVGVESPGEKRVEFTYNTLLFVGLLLLISFFAAYVTGFQRGQGGTPQEMVEETAPPAEEPVPEEVPSVQQTVQVPTPQEPRPYVVQVLRFNDLSGAQGLARRLTRDGYADARVLDFGAAARERYWVVVGRFAGADDPAAAAMIQRLRSHPLQAVRGSHVEFASR